MANEQQAFPKLNTPFVRPDRVIDIPWHQLLITLWNRTGGSSGGGNVPTGAVVLFGGSAIPDGYLLCDGTEVSVVSFPDLFAVIGRTYGPGDGDITFNLPDARGRFPIGAGGAFSPGDSGGSDEIILTIANLPAHSHSVTDPGHTHVQDPHSHAQSIFNNNTGGANGSQGSNNANNATAGTTGAATATNQAAVTGISIDDTGSGDAIDYLPPYLGFNFIIKT